jgi:hypothetical protein
MNASVDGRILGSRWRTVENRMAGLFERLHEQLGGVTGGEYAKAEAYPDHTAGTVVRAAFLRAGLICAPADAGSHRPPPELPRRIPN